MDDLTNIGLFSTAGSDGKLTLSLREAPVAAPGDDEIVVEMRASPINPSDLGLMFGPADTTKLSRGEGGDRPSLSAPLPAWAQQSLQHRIDQPLASGGEGAGVVVRAGANAQALLGKTVGMWGGAMHAKYRTIAAGDVIELPDGISAADGAAMFVNPLTALGFVETMRAQGHKALIHTAAASNLGQMLNKICQQDGIEIVNIVRSAAQVDLLKGIGATIVIDSTAPDFEAQLGEAAAQTGATVGFDATGGGTLASRILAAMEWAATRNLPPANRYGSDTFKQVYIYGALDTGPTILDRWVGFAWSAGGWLLPNFLASAGPDVAARLRRRVVDELTTTFASHYTATIGLADVVDPDIARAYLKRATGEKYLVNPQL